MKFIRDKSVNKLIKEEFADNFGIVIKDKTQILKYLKSFNEPSAYTSQPVIDRFTGKELERVNNAFSDGVYTWYVSEIYHFEKYNLKLNDDFVQYVLAKS